MKDFRFPHEKLEAYQRQREFCRVAVRIRKELPRGWGALGDQLHRAATSGMLNIAEGTGHTRPGEKARFYSIALGSVSECAAVLDALAIGEAASQELLSSGRALLVEVLRMLAALIRRFRRT